MVTTAPASPTTAKVPLSPGSREQQQQHQEVVEASATVASAAAVAGGGVVLVGGPAAPSLASDAADADSASGRPQACSFSSSCDGDDAPDVLDAVMDQVVEWDEDDDNDDSPTKKSATTEAKLGEAQRLSYVGRPHAHAHHVLETVHHFADQTCRFVADWAEKHRVVEKGKNAVARGTAYAVTKLRECMSRDTTIGE